MIGYLKGEVAGIYDDRIILEVQGIGYNICMPQSAMEMIDGIGAEIKVYTYLLVREDALQLYGFLTKDDLDFYKMLITVNGIGPKGALALLSVMNVDELRFAILSGDSKAIGKAPGIGPKTAQRVIIDLKDKIDISSALSDGLSSTGVVADERGIARGSARDEAAQALVALGYSRTDAYRAVRGVGTETDDVETVLKQALAVIAQF